MKRIQGEEEYIMRRMVFRWGAAVAVALILIALVLQVADAQRRGGGRGRFFGRSFCDVDGLWALATFEAKLDAAAMAKLKPICQKAYDERKKITTEAGEAESSDARRAMAGKAKSIGDTLAADAKKALGDDAGKLSAWFERRERTIQFMQERMTGSGRPSRPAETPSTDSSSKKDESE